MHCQINQTLSPTDLYIFAIRQNLTSENLFLSFVIFLWCLKYPSQNTENFIIKYKHFPIKFDHRSQKLLSFFSRTSIVSREPSVRFKLFFQQILGKIFIEFE